MSAFFEKDWKWKWKVHKKQITLPTDIRNELFERRIDKNEMEDNVSIGMKRKAGKMTAEEKRAADVNALQW
jgi:hypothetical protein